AAGTGERDTAYTAAQRTVSSAWWKNGWISATGTGRSLAAARSNARVTAAGCATPNARRSTGAAGAPISPRLQAATVATTGDAPIAGSSAGTAAESLRRPNANAALAAT